MDDDSEVFFEHNGRPHCDADQALSVLLRDEVLFSNERETTFDGKPAGSTTVLYVLCNDLFAWGCADAENLPHGEIERLYKMHKADPIHGSSRWCCIRRNERPQSPIERRWRESGAWDEAMEALSPNRCEINVAKWRAEKATQGDTP